jgi:hypothetical protein
MMHSARSSTCAERHGRPSALSSGSSSTRMSAARSNDGTEIPLVDGGAFDWLAKLTSDRMAVYIASGLGSQLMPLMFRR